MEKFFNVAGPCNPAKHYMLPATERLPDVMRLIRQEQYFAIHAARQSGKTTLLQGLVRDINASDERIALYFTVESVMAYPDPHDGIAKIVERMRGDLLGHPLFGEIARNPAAAPDAPTSRRISRSATSPRRRSANSMPSTPPRQDRSSSPRRLPARGSTRRVSRGS